MTSSRRKTWLRWAARAALVASVVATMVFAERTIRSYRLLASATEIGAPALANIRPWMTLGYVATTYDAPFAQLAKGLDLPPETPPGTTLRSIAESRKMEPLRFIEQVQTAIAAIAPSQPPAAVDEKAAEKEKSDDYLSALLAYRYPALALLLLVGAIGLPVPTGFSTLLAGSMVAIGEMTWPATVGIVIGVSVAGDVIGYAIGRLADENLIARIGRWVGYSGRRKTYIQRLFQRWGGLTILLTRTLVSHLSSLASLLAGISRYPLGAFLGFAFLGRAIWSAIYLGLGYVIGNNIEAAGAFLQNVTGLVLALGVMLMAGSYLFAPRLAASASDA